MLRRGNEPGRPGLAVLLIALVAGCGGGADSPGRAGSEEPSSVPAQAGGALDAESLAKGVGPVRSVELGPLDEELAESGEAVFTSKCSACHKLDERYVGPALRDVTTRRTPEFVMNMILDPEGMLREHPEVKQLLAQYYTPMPNQQLSQDDARAVLEYLRAAAAGAEEHGEHDESEEEH